MCVGQDVATAHTLSYKQRPAAKHQLRRSHASCKQLWLRMSTVLSCTGEAARNSCDDIFLCVCLAMAQLPRLTRQARHKAGGGCTRDDLPVQVEHSANALRRHHAHAGAGVGQAVRQRLELAHQQLVLLLRGSLGVLRDGSDRSGGSSGGVGGVMR